MIPPTSPKQKSRYSVIYTFGESEIVDVMHGLLESGLLHMETNGEPPSWISKVNRLFNVGVPALADHKEAFTQARRSLEGVIEIVQQNNVAICVAQIVVSCDSLRFLE